MLEQVWILTDNRSNERCPQRKVLSPLLWSMLIEMLCDLQELSVCTKVYADDVALLAVYHDFVSVSRNIQRSVNLIGNWYLCHMLFSKFK